MKVFVTGATGVLGKRLVKQLDDTEHTVYGLVRDDRGETIVEERNGIPRRGDVLKLDTLNEAIDEDIDVIIHAATQIPVKNKPTEDDWAENDRIRTEGAKNLVSAAGEQLSWFMFPSLVWVARQPDGSRYDETSERHPDRATQSAADVEDYLQNTATDRGFEMTILRAGFFYAPDAGHTRSWGKQLISGDLPIVGRGLLGRKDAELSFLHADDAARAFVAALNTDATGIYHVFDGNPVTVADFFTVFAEKLDAPEPSRIPGWVARFFVGKVNANTLTTPMPTTNEKFQQEVSWEPQYPTYREGLEQVVRTWESDGTLRKAHGEYEWNGE